MSNAEKEIIALIDDIINPGLAAHGGCVELNEITLCGDGLGVILDFKGGCYGSPSSVSHALKSTEFLLREELSAPTLLVKNSKDL